eukprot:scaffold19400_cov104-Isochrysis_galbana.AAC.3
MLGGHVRPRLLARAHKGSQGIRVKAQTGQPRERECAPPTRVGQHHELLPKSGEPIVAVDSAGQRVLAVVKYAKLVQQDGVVIRSNVSNARQN